MSNRTVYLLCPIYSKTRILRTPIDGDRSVLRYYCGGENEIREQVFEWSGSPKLPRGDFPSDADWLPLLSPRLVERFGDELRKAGRLLPVKVQGSRSTKPLYSLYVVDHVVDCLSVAESSKPAEYTDEMERVVFHGDRLEPQYPAFRIPQAPTFVFWSAPFIEALKEFGVKAVEFRAVWSDDPSVVLTPKPMR